MNDSKFTIVRTPNNRSIHLYACRVEQHITCSQYEIRNLWSLVVGIYRFVHVTCRYTCGRMLLCHRRCRVGHVCGVERCVNFLCATMYGQKYVCDAEFMFGFLVTEKKYLRTSPLVRAEATLTCRPLFKVVWGLVGVLKAYAYEYDFCSIKPHYFTCHKSMITKL